MINMAETMARLAQGPMLVAPESQQTYMLQLASLAESLAVMTPEASHELAVQAGKGFWDFSSDSYMAQLRPYQVSNGTLTIPVKGSLLSGFPYAWGDYATGYEYIQAAFDRGMADPEVSRVAFMVDSPGGEVAGNFDLVDHLAASKTKPTLAIVADHAYSAAYNIASAADKITVTRTGGVGSIGVVTMHVDMTEYLKKVGMKVTHIHAGKFKVEGNPYEPLGPEAEARIQSRIDGLYDIFVSSVARNRGMAEQAVRDTEALTYSAQDGIAIGLADAVKTSKDALAAFEGTAARKTTKGVFMANQTENAAATSEATPSSEQLAQARTEGALAERARIQGILALDEAQTRKATASQLAMTTDLTVEQAQGVLAGIPAEVQEQAKADTGAFEAAMAQDNPNISGGVDAEAEAESPAQAILASYRQAQGI